MNDEWWEPPICWLCDYWWALFLALVLALTGYFTRDFWLPRVGVTPPPPATATPSLTLEPALTPIPSPTLVLGSGDVQVTLRWNTYNDIDLYVIDPLGVVIYYGYPYSSSGGQLDVDANRGCGSNMTDKAVENIFWPTGAAPAGTFRVAVDYFANCSGAPLVDFFTVRVLVDGAAKEFSGTVTQVRERITVYEFTR